MMFALDTDTFTLAFHGSRGVRERVAAEQAAGEVVVPAMTRVEVLTGRFEAVRTAADGPGLARAVASLRASELYLRQFRLLPFIDKAVTTFDCLRTDKSARKVRRNDLLIACIALAHAATLVTRNAKDFALVPGLKHVNWAN